MTSDEVELAERAAIRLASDPSADPVTGAMLGMGETPAGVLGGASDTPAGERTRNASAKTSAAKERSR